MASEQMIHVTAYVSREEKEYIKTLAREQNLSVSSLLQELIRDFRPADIEKVAFMEGIVKTRKSLSQKTDELERLLGKKTASQDKINGLIKDIEKDMIFLRECMEKLS